MAEIQTRPVPDPPVVAPVPDRRVTLRRAARCWFGALLLIVMFSGLFTYGPWWESVGPIGLLTAAAAVLATLLALVLESLRGREVGIGGHVLLAAVGGAMTLGLLSVHGGFALLGAVVGGIGAALGAGATAGRPTWVRYAALLGGAVLVGVLIGVG